MAAAAAFLARILAEPAEDTHRLVYADFLDEQDDERVPCPNPKCVDGWVTTRVWHGPSADDDEHSTSSGRCPTCQGSRSVPAGNAARAEFIRFQVELAKWEPCNPAFEPTEQPTLRARERELWPTVRPWYEGMLREAGVWDGTGPTPVGIDWKMGHPYLVGRGFVAVARGLTLAEFVGDRPCPRCQIRGAIRIGPGVCTACSGLGRIRACPECGDAETNPDTPLVRRASCALCHRTGTLPALAPKLARVPGIAEVWAADRVPEESRQHPGWWRWYADDDMRTPSAVTDLLYPLLSGECPDPEGTQPYWKTAALATSALARAGGGLLRSL